MALDVIFKSALAGQLRGILTAHFCDVEPAGGEFLNALDAVGEVNGLERVRGPSGGWKWIVLADNRGLLECEE